MPSKIPIHPALYQYGRRFSAWTVVLWCTLIMLASCSGYEQLLKSDDFQLKYEKAKEYYNRGSYSRALPLFKQLLTVEKGTDREEELMYFIAYSHYGQGEYLLASALFKNYYTFFPNTARTAECHYMSAYSNFLYSPRLSLDQSTTFKAIGAFQLFINAHPKSDSVAAANRMIDLMRNKLEQKSLDAADLYYKTGHYQAAAVAYQSTLTTYPDIDNAEYIRFLVLQSYMEFADRSIVCKQEERYGQALEAYSDLTERHPEGAYQRESENLRERALRERDKSKERCYEQEKVRKFLSAELALRNKDFVRASRLFDAYVYRFPEADNADEAQVNLLRSRLELARDAAGDCAAIPLYQNALDTYYRFLEVFPESSRIDQAERYYDAVLLGQDSAKKKCDEYH